MANYILLNPITFERNLVSSKVMVDISGLTPQGATDLVKYRRIMKTTGCFVFKEKELPGKKELSDLINSIRPKNERWLKSAYLPDNYEISDLGRVRKLEKGKDKILMSIRKKRERGSDYMYIHPLVVHADGVKARRPIPISRLVASAFLTDTKQRIPSDLRVIHLDRNIHNNNVSNLKIMTRSEVSAFGSMFNKKGHCVAKLDSSGNILDVYSSLKEAAKANFFNRQALSEVFSAGNNEVCGFKWKRITREEYEEFIDNRDDDYLLKQYK